MDTNVTPTATPTVERQVRERLDEIWSAAASRDFDRLESFHHYGPEFTEFKEGRPRGDAASCAAGERAVFSRLADIDVDMRDLAVNSHADVAVVTFNGHFTGRMAGTPIALDQQCTMVFARVGGDWKIVHEHMSPIVGLDASGAAAGGGPA